jgi:hypothetical protein
VIDATVITYGGGAFACDGCSLRTSRVVLKGAAQNTFNILLALGVIPGPKAAPKRPTPQIVENNNNEIEVSPQPSFSVASLAGFKQ